MVENETPRQGEGNATSQSGAVLVLVCLALIALMGVMALAIDAASIYVSHLQQDNNAEYAALAAVRQSKNPLLPPGSPGSPLNPGLLQAATARAEVVAGLNHYVGNIVAPGTPTPVQVKSGELENGRAGSIQFGFWSDTSRSLVVGGGCDAQGIPTLNCVQVTLTTKRSNPSDGNLGVRTLFARIYNVDWIDMRSQAIAVAQVDSPNVRLVKNAQPSTQRDLYDVNGDGDANIGDANAIANYLSTNGAGPTGQRTCFDLDADGRIDADDLVEIQTHVN